MFITPLDFLSTIMLFYLRLMPTFFILPLFQGGWFSHYIIKICLAVALGLPFIPEVYPGLQQMGQHPIRGGITEIILGVLIALPVGLPFWVANVAGQMMDNQRGATISSSFDPNTGVDASVMAGWFQFICSVVFISDNGIIHICELLRESYKLFPPGISLNLSLINIGAFIELIDISLGEGIILISPTLFALFLCDVLLAVLSRYTPQLNPFSLSLTVKSLLAFSMLFLYFNSTFTKFLQHIIDDLRPLEWYFLI